LIENISNENISHERDHMEQHSTLKAHYKFTEEEVEILTVLGSLLVLWVAIELIHEEINQLQGKGFAIGAKIKAKYIPLMLNQDLDKYPKEFAKTAIVPILNIINSDTEVLEHQFVGYSSRSDFLRRLKAK